MYRWGFGLGLAALMGCGPSVETPAGSDSSSDSGADSTSTTGVSAESSATIASTGTSTTVTTSVGTIVSDSSEDSEGDGATFITAPDVPDHCGYCDVWAQDCPEDMKCSPYACVGDDEVWDATRCVELDDDPAQVGEPCTVQDSPVSGIDDCEPSSLCWNVDPETLTGECVPFCFGSEANPLCEVETDSCVQSNDGVLTLCLPECEPLEPACAVDESCTWNRGGDLDFVCMPEELVPGQAYGDDCSEGFGCGDGLVCQSAGQVPGCEGTHCCTLLGSLDAPPVCPDVTQSCTALYEDGEGPGWLQQLCFCGVAP